MDNKNTRKKKTSNPLGVAVIIAAAFIGMVSENADRPELLIVVLGGLALLAGLIVAVVYLAKKKGAEKKEINNPFTHSHDRLSRQAAANCSVDEHWKAQLDGFLKAGIIDRKEYAVLMERHGRIYDGKRP